MDFSDFHKVEDLNFEIPQLQKALNEVLTIKKYVYVSFKFF